MLELTALIILICSLAGIGFILFKKIPFLVELTERETKRQPRFFYVLQKRISANSFLRAIPFEIILQRILSKIRVLALKIENKIGFWLQRLREKAQKRKVKEKDNYWRRLRKTRKER